MKRLCDFVTALLLIILTSVPFIVIALAVKLTSPGPAIHWSLRVGKDNRPFHMPKFRTMKADTPVVATHLLADAGSYLTLVGLFLRKTSFDELPQIWSLLKGDMSLVGPRPALFNQDDLIELRTKKGIDKLVPGITGWAQINGRDDLTIPDKVSYDEYYMKNQSCLLDMKILWETFFKVITKEGVIH